MNVYVEPVAIKSDTDSLYTKEELLQYKSIIDAMDAENEGVPLNLIQHGGILAYGNGQYDRAFRTLLFLNDKYGALTVTGYENLIICLMALQQYEACETLACRWLKKYDGVATNSQRYNVRWCCAYSCLSTNDQFAVILMTEALDYSSGKGQQALLHYYMGTCCSRLGNAQEYERHALKAVLLYMEDKGVTQQDIQASAVHDEKLGEYIMSYAMSLPRDTYDDELRIKFHFSLSAKCGHLSAINFCKKWHIEY